MVRELLEVSRKRRRRRILTKVVWAFSLTFFGLLGFTSVFYIPFVRISSISINGLTPSEEKVLEEEISRLLSQKYFSILPQDNLFFFSKYKLKEFLRNNPRIKEFNIEREFPSTLVITIEEREPWAIWCRKLAENKDCSFVDKEGYVFAKAASFSGSVILKLIDERDIDFFAKKVLSPEALSKINLFINGMERRLNEYVLTVVIKTQGDTFELLLKNGWYVIFDSSTDAGKALGNLILTLDSEIKEEKTRLEYVDLRFPNKVFFRLKGKN